MSNQPEKDTFHQISELGRKAQLAAHINSTLSRAQTALTTGNVDRAMEVIIEAAKKYEQLGGPPPVDPATFIQASQVAHDEIMRLRNPGDENRGA